MGVELIQTPLVELIHVTPFKYTVWAIYEDVSAVARKPAAWGQDHLNILKRLRPEVNFKF